ncbi:MAG TPA: hypothetical protein VLB83_03770 [Candidatus Paceibacterota bacterium]|nr:hypothetical protein [Candidatus Paceibacterota bacterium]
MATAKTRINVSVSDEVERALAALAKRDQVPQATKASELLRAALEIEEDRVLDRIASERDGKHAKYVSHEAAWR